MAQLRDWTLQLRLNAARSLHSTLLLAGPATSQHLPHLLGPLCSAAGDEDFQVAAHVVKAAQVWNCCSMTTIAYPAVTYCLLPLFA